KRNEPDVFARAVRIGEYQDYLTYHLTGRWAGSLNNAAVRWHHGPEGPPRGLLAALDLNDLLEKWPQEILAPGAPLGGLTGAASAHLGLPAGLPVIQGGADAFIGMIGLGVSEPGELALITGSSHLVLGIAEAKTHRPGMWGAYADAVYPGKYVVEGGQTSTGSVLAWFKRHFAADTPWDDLNDAAAAIPPGAEGLLSLDHFQGNRTPFTDPHSRGALVGLSLAHTPGHVFRALVEGVCLGTRLTVDQFGDAFRPSRIVVAGGATNSPLWLSIHASTLGAPIERTEAPEAPLLGCAILAAHGAGRFASIEEGCRAMVRTQETVAPDLAAQQDYAKMLPRYEALYHGLKALRA
ncbi:MAG: FGGY-family carbohydrate kinase, partial [Pseudomonadota bacterium]